MLNSEVIFKVFNMHGQHVFEYTPILPSEPSTAAFPVSSITPKQPAHATTDVWHCGLNRHHAEAISKLPDAANGIKINKSALTLCESCAVSNAKQIVSRRPADRATVPFGHVHIDLIQLHQAYNGDCWVLHFLNDYSRMNFIYTLLSEELASDTIQNFASFVFGQFGHRIRIFQTDHERSSIKDFKHRVARKGIGMELAATYTSAQNGATERSGGVLTAKARALRIHAHFLQFLWPESLKAAAYLANRSPSKSLNWSTPFEQFYSSLNKMPTRPNLAHSRAYGCHTYA
jgi:hypothetical protein